MWTTVKEKLSWLKYINLVEFVLVMFCAFTGFSFIILGTRPGEGRLSTEIPLPYQFIWNGCLLVFGMVALASFFHSDLVTRKLLRLFSYGGLSLSLLAYGSGMLLTFGWERASLTISSLIFFFLMFAGTALQIVLTLERKKKS